MRILFTGATGVIGRPAVPLLASHHEVVAVARRAEDRVWLEQTGATPVTLDLFDPEAVGKAMAGVDTVIHFATAIPPQAEMAKRPAWDLNDRLRAEATSNLVDAALANRVSRFIQESITFFYADGGGSWLDESATIAPVWDILDSALVAEQHAARFGGEGGTAVVLRFGRLYGAGDASREYLDSVRRRKLPVLGRGDNYVSSLHVGDAATALVAALEAPTGTYNVVDDSPERARDVIDALASELGAPQPRHIPVSMAKLAVGPASMLLAISHRVSNRAFKEATGWNPKYRSVLDGWKDVVEEAG